MGRLVVAAVIVFMAVGGLAFSFGVPMRPAAAPKAPFPWTGPVDTFRTLKGIGKDALLAITVAVNSYFWFVGALQLMIINMMGKTREAGIVPAHSTQRSNTIAGLFIAAILVGNGIGGLAAGRLSKGEKWYRLLWPASVAMGLAMMAVELVPHVGDNTKLPAMFGILVAVGIAGGFMLVPTDSFIQVRSKSTERGAIIATSTFTSYGGIIIASFLANYLNVHFRPTTGFALCGGLTVLVGLWTAFALRPSKNRK